MHFVSLKMFPFAAGSGIATCRSPRHVLPRHLCYCTSIYLFLYCHMFWKLCTRFAVVLGIQ